MSVERIVAEIVRQARLRDGQAYTLTVKPRGSEPIIAQRTKLHSGFLEIEQDLHTVVFLDNPGFNSTHLIEVEGPAKPAAPHEKTRTYFVPFDAIDWVVPKWL